MSQPYHLNREVYRDIKNKSKDQMEQYMRNYYSVAYNQGITETYLAVFHHLHDMHDFSNEQLEELFYACNNDIEAINQRYISTEEILNGLIGEGVTFLKRAKR